MLNKKAYIVFYVHIESEIWVTLIVPSQAWKSIVDF